MLKTYPAIFHQEEDNAYWVEFPNFQGGTQGDDLEEAMLMAKEFLAGSIAYFLEEDIALPTPVDITKLAATDGFATLIQADPAPYIKGNKTVRKNITIPEWLVKKADKEHINYSKTLTQALIGKLKL